MDTGRLEAPERTDGRTGYPKKETGIDLTGKNTPEVLATLKTAQQITKLLKSGTSQSVIQDVDKAMNILTESTAKIKKAYALFGALTDPGKGK
ncbi:hypothetical protein [uncultured Megasphaera sp.]|uniref:hypothetical protein n=1 Tax=uncultured Megasphaera sp. TaxID=165188 RepID=UPI00266D781B|nr:hypothetical protein [uncultured Megasphaera sp.]